MTLLELLVKELPKRGGWPEDIWHVTQDSDGQVNGYGHSEPYLNIRFWNPEGFIRYLFGGERKPLSVDWRSSVITREQYEAAIASQQPIAEFHSRTFPTFKAITVVERDDSWVGTKVDGEDYHCYKRHWDIEFISERRQITEPALEIEYVKYNGIDSINQKTNDPVWNGEGLPPVGSKVESFINGEWKLVKVVYTGDPGGKYEALVFDVKTTKPAWSDLFRPLRTEADRKREEAINAISLAYDTQDRFGNYRSATGVYEDIAAGKIPGVELSK